MHGIISEIAVTYVSSHAHFTFQITSLNHKYFRTHLEDALSLGRPLLVEDVEEELDPVLDNLLERNFIKSGTVLKVRVCDHIMKPLSNIIIYIHEISI